MLVLSRLVGQRIIIGDDIIITILDIRGAKVRIGIAAHESIPVHREEVFNNIERERQREGGHDG
jgi:carbon storage regulator